MLFFAYTVDVDPDDTDACETLVSCPALIWLTAQDDFNALIPSESSNLKTVILKDSVRDVKQYVMKG